MGFEKLTAYMDALGDYPVPARDVAVWQGHRSLYRHMAGCSDPAGKVPVTAADVYLLYSSTKPVTCAGALRLVERGQLSLEDPVAKYLPEYGEVLVRDGAHLRPPKAPMKIKDLFTMCGGLSYRRDTPALLAVKDNATITTREVVRLFTEEPLLFDPAEHFEYSLCHDVLAAVVEVITGKRFGTYLKDELFTPLGMESTAFHLTPEMQAHRTTPFVYNAATDRCEVDPAGNSFRLSEQYESGGAGIYSTTDDCIKFADALACGGTAWNGYEVLRPETVAAMGKNQLGAGPLADFQQKTGHLGYGYGLGVSVLMDRKPRHFHCPEGIFGWGGAAGTRIFVDTKNQISIFYMQEVLGGTCETYETHPHNVILNLVYEALGIN